MTFRSRYLAQTDTCVNGTDNSGRPTAPKEVDSVNSIQTRETANQIALIPSTFGMPACGHAFGSADVARIQGDVSLDMAVLAVDVRTYAQGTSAWSPPS
jgi:hypothetical protein